MGDDTRKRKRRSAAWEYFDQNEAGDCAKCRICSKQIKTSSGGTTGLIRHLESIHKMNFRPAKNDSGYSDHGPDSHEVLSRLAAEDGLSFFAIANSSTLRSLYQNAMNANLPSSPSTIRHHVMQYAEKQKALMKEEIKNATKKFSLSLDEWTSISSRRYMCVNLHGGSKFWNLGLARVTGTFSSDACLTLLKHKLDEFEVDLNDIVAIATDGASVMRRFAELSDRHHQLCLAHGLHLAVSDVLYCPQESPPIVDESESEESEDEDGSGLSRAEEGNIEYVETVNSIITKVRRFVRHIRSSPKKLEIFQKHAGENVKLILDVKTRWNSMHSMMARFWQQKEALQKTFIDLHENIDITEYDFDKISEIVSALDPIKVAAELICQRDATLIDADVAIGFMLDNISALGSDLAASLSERLLIRMQERRSVLSDVASYLRFGTLEAEIYQKGYFVKLTRVGAVNRIKEISDDLVINEDSSINDGAESDNTQESESLLAELGLKQQLALAISKARTFTVAQVIRNNRDTLTSIRREMQIFESTGKRGKVLQKVYECLMTIPPSTVEAERVFSSANYFCTKIRSRLSDKSLDALVFLRYFFKTK